MKVSKHILMMSSHLHLQFVTPKKLLIFNVNNVLCSFPHFAIRDGSEQVFGRNIDRNKVEVRVGVENFLSIVLKYFYITIWSCMKLEDMLEVLPMLIPKIFLEWFVFIWGCEQCSKTFNQISLKFYYYLKDLNRMYYNYHGLPYGKDVQMLLIDNEPSKAF